MKVFKKSMQMMTMVAILTGTLSTGAVQAEGKESLVSLGDSITFGLNLEKNNNHVSKNAYPSIIAESENFRVRNLGVSGDTTEDLLILLQTDKYRDAIRHADVITLNIGNNDFLQGARSLIQELLTNENFEHNDEDIQLLETITQTFGLNLYTIIQEIRNLTDAPIILYNLYNPFFGFDQKAGLVLSGANNIIQAYDADPGIVVVDAFGAFAGKQNTLILPGDVHPTTEGQELLAQLGIQALKTLE